MPRLCLTVIMPMFISYNPSNMEVTEVMEVTRVTEPTQVTQAMEFTRVMETMREHLGIITFVCPERTMRVVTIATFIRAVTTLEIIPILFVTLITVIMFNTFIIVQVSPQAMVTMATAPITTDYKHQENSLILTAPGAVLIIIRIRYKMIIICLAQEFYFITVAVGTFREIIMRQQHQRNPLITDLMLCLSLQSNSKKLNKMTMPVPMVHMYLMIRLKLQSHILYTSFFLTEM